MEIQLYWAGRPLASIADAEKWFMWFYTLYIVEGVWK